MLIFKEFSFEAAHFLPNVPPGHKCARVHGHSYKVRVEVEGRVGQRSGWVIDYADVAKAWVPIHERLDHRLINEVPGLENSTAEHLAMWLWDILAPQLPGLSAIEVQETPTAGVRYTGD